MKKHILFICNGNIHRSVIAAESLRKILAERNICQDIFIDSYGLQGTGGTDLPKYTHLSEYKKEWKAAQPILEKLGIDIRMHRFQKISESVLRRASVVIAMDDAVYKTAGNSLLKQFPKHTKKIHPFSALTAHGKGMKDLAGNGNGNSHKKVIEEIYFTLAKNDKTILTWIES